MQICSALEGSEYRWIRCILRPHNTAPQRAEPQDKDECKTVLHERGLTFDGYAASSQTAQLRGRSDGNIAVQDTLSGCPHGVAHDHGGN